MIEFDDIATQPTTELSVLVLRAQTCLCPLCMGLGYLVSADFVQYQGIWHRRELGHVVCRQCFGAKLVSKPRRQQSRKAAH